MKTLLLLRHAKSSWDDPGVADADRPLTARGHKAASRMGRLIAQRGLSPDLILCSTARRARETCDSVAPELTSDPDLRFEDQLYMADPATLLHLVQHLPDNAHATLVIGHNPGLERFAARLTGVAAGNALQRMAGKFPTAALAVFRFDIRRWRDVGLARGRLEDFVAPREVEKD
jgi:phosphohistidine phosphatase